MPQTDTFLAQIDPWDQNELMQRSNNNPLSSKIGRRTALFLRSTNCYESKGERMAEAAQLREYPKYASNPQDAAMVRKYLSDLGQGSKQPSQDN